MVIPDEFANKKAKPYDKPDEAAAFFKSKRIPEGETRSYGNLWFEAKAQSENLPLYSSRLGREMGRDEVVRSGVASWESLGPGNIGGRTRAMVINPDNPDHMVSGGVAGGMWVTMNGGESWTATGDNLASIAVCSMAMDRNDPMTILAGTGEGFFSGGAVRGGGIFKSTDGGMTWVRLDATTGEDFFYVQDIVASVVQADTFYAATRTGIFRSADGGDTWTLMVSAAAFNGAMDLEIRTDQTTNDVLFATIGTLTQSVLVRNDDAAGEGVFNIVYTEANMARSSVSVAPSNQDIVYLLMSTSTGQPISSAFTHGLLGIMRSEDGGDTWADVHRTELPLEGADLILTNSPSFVCFGGTSISSQGFYDQFIRVDPIDPDIVWTGGIDTFRSDDGGRTWGIGSLWWLNPTFPEYTHADLHNVFYHPDYNGTTNRKMYVVGDGGIYSTEDARAPVAPVTAANVCSSNNEIGMVWKSLNNNYGVTQFYHGLPFPSGTAYFGGTQDNGTLLSSDRAGAEAWIEIFGGDGGYVAYDPTNTFTMYVATTGISIRKSIDGGLNFAGATSGIADQGLFINPYLMDPNDPNRLWTGGTFPWRTDDAAGNWVQAGPSFGINHSAWAVAPGNSDLVLAGTTLGIIRRTTEGTTATADTNWGASWPVRGNVSSVAFDPQDTNIAYATYSTFGIGHVWRSTDSGQSWTNIDNGLPDIPVHSVAVHPADSNRIYIGTDLGVYVSTNSGMSWSAENTGYANVVTEWLQFIEDDCRVILYAFTHGRGAWRLPLSSITLSAPGTTVPLGGDTGSFDVTALANCEWSASTDDDWIRITAGDTGTSNGTVEFSVAPNTGASARTGIIRVGTRSFTIEQAGDETCTFELSAAFVSFPAAVSQSTFDVTATPGTCSYAAVSNDNWLFVIEGALGTGSGTVGVGVRENTTFLARTGTITVEDQTFTVNQAAAIPCTFTLGTSSGSFDAMGGEGSFTVATSPDSCSWTATTDDSWITIGVGSGSGAGSVSFTVAANIEATARFGVIRVDDQAFVVQQAAGAGCTYTLSEESASFTADAGEGTFTVTSSQDACTWTATTQSAWITITSGATGTGTADVAFSVAANTATTSRVGTIQVADQVFTVTQAAGVACTYTLDPVTETFTSTGGSGTFSVTTNAQTCDWTATTQFNWISLPVNATGTGDGSVTYTVAPNTTSAARTGVIQVGDQIFTVEQDAASACDLTLSSDAVVLNASGGQAGFDITTNLTDCGWTATASDPWILITQGQNGAGNGSVSFTAQAVTEGFRRATITVFNSDETLTFTVSQGACVPSETFTSSLAGWPANNVLTLVPLAGCTNEAQPPANKATSQPSLGETAPTPGDR
ncbi:BACON domain-containing protein [Acanthopleuribacter pedis]|uniref:BACON domain-containing protein n=1 Tax=Acanthopleuribacter pedis TaxID=442870 RepID=A0A8J7U2R4_9BACT|nr:BACON domain-containing carbohydrate-binding protein [Acanthopleuribacter pedis]MBO1319593.1 hypothetical protein [Acanthopleuribacter pedis]